MNVAKNNLFFIFFGVIFTSNAILSSQFELSFDEAYYWMYSEYLAFGYFDHPPMVALMIKFGTSMFGNTEFGVRFGANVLMCLSIYLGWLLLGKKHTLLLFVSVLSMPLISFSGLIALPDTPLLFFGTLYFFTLKKFMGSSNFKTAIYLALAIAGLFYSKYHGILIVLLTVLAYPHFLKQKLFYFVAVLVTVFYLPHMWWQYQHDFVSFKFHLTGRVEKHFDISNIINYLSGQIGLLGIFNFFIIIYIFYKEKFKAPFERILMFNTIGFLIFLFIMSFRNQIEANWTITCSMAFLVLFLGRIETKFKKLYIGFAIVPILIVLAFKFVIIAAPTISKTYELKDHRLNTIVDWKEKKIPAILELCEDRLIVGDNYQVTSKLAFYTGREIAALHLNSRESQYSILKLQKSIPRDKPICFLSSKVRLPSVKIESYYKDPVYVAVNTTLEELAKANGTTYEEILRN